MTDQRLDAAIDAAARALHEDARESHQWRWDNAPEAWKANLRGFVRPLVVAALARAEAVSKAEDARLASGEGKPIPEIAAALQIGRRRQKTV